MTTETLKRVRIDQEPLEHAIMDLISNKDFDGYLIQRFDTRVVEAIPSTMQTACLMYLNGRFYIQVVETFFSKLTNKERVAVLKHEVAHFVNKHFARRCGRDPYIFNIAGDCAINQGIADMPEGGVTLPQGWDPSSATEYYYDKFLQQAKKAAKGVCNKCGGSRGKQSNNGQGKNGKGKNGQQGQSPGKGNQPQQGNGPCTCGGTSRNGLPDLFDEVMDAPFDAGAESDSMAGEIIRETIRERLNAGVSAEKLRGLHAGNLNDYVEDLTAPPITSWRHVLSRFAATLADEYNRITLKRPDRRGLSPFGKRKEYLPALIVCVDTSGSIDDEMLATFFSQIRLLGMQLSSIEVVIADAEVHEHFTYRRGLEERLKKSGFGRGGTDFDPAIIYINKKLSHCDGVVYLTDGWCPVPKTKCKLPLIWVVTEADKFEGHPKVLAPIGRSGRR